MLSALATFAKTHFLVDVHESDCAALRSKGSLDEP